MVIAVYCCALPCWLDARQRPQAPQPLQPLRPMSPCDSAASLIVTRADGGKYLQITVIWHTHSNSSNNNKRGSTLHLLVLLSFQNWGRGEVATFSLEIHVSAWMRGVCMKLQSIYLSYHAHMLTRLCFVHTIIWICVCIFTNEYLLNRALLSNKTRASSLITLRKFEHRTGQPRQRNRTQSNSVLID